MQSLGEMTTWLPLPGAIPQLCARYVDEAMGFAVGWNVSSSTGNVFSVLDLVNVNIRFLEGVVFVHHRFVC